MEEQDKAKSSLEQAVQDLFNYAVDREEVKWLMTHLAAEADINRPTVEYELQILKIISVGWSLSYYLPVSPQKDQLMELFWKPVYEFSKDLSETTEMMIGQNIDYFQTLKDRLDMYVAALEQNPDVSEPATVIGPEFAKTCGNVDDIFTVMAGSKMFISITTRVKDYLEAIKLR
jgi:hypothetical protein